MAVALASLGFNLNFGPMLVMADGEKQSEDAFGKNPLESGVFGKTFVLGHREADVIAVPVIDGSEPSIRALKTILVSYPDTPVAVAAVPGQPLPFLQSGLIQGPRFCLAAPKGSAGAPGAVESFRQGCDILVLDEDSESPAAFRDQVGQAISEAIAKGELTKQQLMASAQRAAMLRPLASRPGEAPTRSAGAP
jgi:hypothetical protein